MKFKHFANIVLPIFLFGFFTTTYAQTNQPFSWKETTDPWYMPKDYTYKLLPDEFLPKGTTNIGHGPAFTNDCRESTAPDACTGSLIKEKLGAVKLPSGLRIPAGYSGAEYVTFEVQKNGKVYGYQVVKQAVKCPPCIQTAVNEVASLGEWYPATQEGITVKSTVVVPVYFK